jgi:hypothetical protein
VLALHIFYGSLAQDSFKKYTLMGHMLVDDPKAIFAGGEDEGLSKLAQRLEGAEVVEGLGGLFGFDLSGGAGCAGGN